jgi:hypothetical protein
MARRPTILGDERGAALFIAILAMLLLGVFALSAVVMASLETRLGLNQKEAQQALALAEGGLEHARNMMADAVGAGNYDAFIASDAARRLGIASRTDGIPAVGGRYWVRVDNDCTATGALSPPLVPATVEDDPDGPGGVTCDPTADENETVVLTAWARTDSGRGQAMVRAHYVTSNPWKHSCYDTGDGELCIDDAVGGCNNNPCIDPSDPEHPNGPAEGLLPIPNDIRCGKQSLGGAIPDDALPADVRAVFTGALPCVIYPYFQWALQTAAPTRRDCMAGACQTPVSDPTFPGGTIPAGTIAYDSSVTTCTTSATASKCHGMVFFGPGIGSNPAQSLAIGADVSLGTSPSDNAGCMGTTTDPRNDMRDPSSPPPPCPGGQNSTVVVYVMGKLTIKNNVGVNGTVVLHGNGTDSGGSSKDLSLTGTNRVKTFKPCTNPSLAGFSPGCGYPLAILAYNPPDNAAADSPGPPTSGQSIVLDLSDATTLISGIIYTGGESEFGPINVDGGIIGWDVSIENTATRIVYNSQYGNDAPPPAFTTPGSTEFVTLVRPTWIHCRTYGDQWDGPTACQ